MKRFLVAFCLSIATAFAGSYDIEEFTATDAGTPDEYITAEFGGQLKTAPADEVSSLQDGRLVVRQKFTDPFGETPTAYQLYQGGKGDLSGLVALTAEGVDYSKLVTTRIYARRGMPIEEDVEKVYFDGKAVYVPGLSSAIAFVDGSMVQLKGDESAAPAEEEAPAPEVASSEEEECDEYDPDCEDEEEDEDIDVKGDLDESNSRADERDYAISDASENATDRFGIADEVRFWTAVGLSALAVTGAVIGVMQQMEANKAKDAYDDLDEVHSGIMAGITSACAADKEPAACEVAMKQYATYNTTEKYTLADLEARMDTNKKTQDSYTFARNLWFGVTAVSLTAAIVLFVW
ncbi:MAG: hypothetical protein II850_11515 [Fibrobacter sp.]|jgi:hypothetical protein|uniref:hypothetical protein n=1 Tax=unclassified Fibrobacter TaxID=2634177 RepID=UPI0009130152|nr:MULTISPECIES: hypothetical protein [unclassified Fibrobacter]MBQ3721584.1 hypothetical protein [Fibrobacter sp.]MBQ9225682.1 hypothetical protein [Fibrobacter sp.]SHH19060.1 hypothetical protein SAMN05720761_11053 [Fibrobacter sp. UWCM]